MSEPGIPQETRDKIKAQLHPLVRELDAAGVPDALVQRVGELVWQAAEWAREATG